jgi:hypothetical protein
MAWSIVQHTSLAADATGTTIALAYGSNIGTAQSALFSFTSNDIGQTVSTVVDTLLTSYGQAEGDSGTAQRATIYGGEASASGGANTVTVTFSATTAHRRLAIFEITGQNAPGTGNFIDQANGTSGTGTAANAPSVTTLFDGELVLGHVIAEADSTITAGTNLSFTKDEDYGHTTVVAGVEHGTQTTHGAIVADWTLGTSRNFIAQVVTLRPAAAGTPALYDTSMRNPLYNTLLRM